MLPWMGEEGVVVIELREEEAGTIQQTFSKMPMTRSLILTDEADLGSIVSGSLWVKRA